MKNATVTDCTANPDNNTFDPISDVGPTQLTVALIVVPLTWIKMVMISHVTKIFVIQRAGMRRIRSRCPALLAAQIVREATR